MKWITSLFKKDKNKEVLDVNVKVPVSNVIQDFESSYTVVSPKVEKNKRFEVEDNYEDDNVEERERCELYDAMFSNDIDRMIRALKIKTDDITNRHFLLQSIISESYRLRKDEYYSNLCLKFSEIHLKEFDVIANAFRNKDGTIPHILVFQNYATLLTELGEFAKAINVCKTAISYELDDFTKGGYQGRIDRIEKKMNK